MNNKPDYTNGIASIVTINNRICIEVLFQGIHEPVLLFFKGSVDSVNSFLKQNFPNLVTVDRWVFDYELDSVTLFHDRSPTLYNQLRRSPI